MGLRDKLKNSVRTVLDRFSGEYSAGSGEIRPDDAPLPSEPGDVRVTRARLKRPRDAKEAVDASKEPT